LKPPSEQAVHFAGTTGSAAFENLYQLARSVDSATTSIATLRILDASEWWYVANVRTSGIVALTEFIASCRQANFSTSTKIVATIFKLRNERGVFHDRNEKSVHRFLANQTLPPHFKLATIVRNRREYAISTSAADVESIFQQLSVGVPADHQLRRETVREQLFPRVRGNYVWAGQLKHPNPFVDKITVRPTSPSWRFDLIFVRAASD
jgi:hypothetical protein